MTRFKQISIILSSLAILAMPLAAAQASDGRNEHSVKTEINSSFKPNFSFKGLKTVVGAVSAKNGNILTLNAKLDLEDEIEHTASSTPSTASSTSAVTYTVDVSHAQLVALNHALPLNVANISIGDKLQVKGTITGTNIVASYVRDLTLKKTIRPITGVITSLSPSATTTASSTSSFTLSTNHKGKTSTTTVNVTGSTQIRQAGATTTSSFANLTVGAKVKVIGFWNKVTNTISALFVKIF